MFKKPFKRPGGFNDRGGDRSGPRTELYPAVCSQCNKACEVPFRPNGRKPVYCRDCFGAHRDDSGSNFGSDRSPRRDARPAPFQSQSEDTEIAALKRQVAAMNVKVDTMLRILESSPRATVQERVAAPTAPSAPSKNDIQEAIRKDLVKKRVAKKARAKK